MTIATFPELAYAQRPGDYELGRVDEVISVPPETVGIDDPTNRPRETVMYGITDPYVAYLRNTSPERFDEIRAQETVMDEFARDRRVAGMWQREPGTPYIDAAGTERIKRRYGDPESQQIFTKGDGYIADPDITAWRKTIPSATALLPLVNPSNIEASTNTREWMTVCTDGWEIRNRGTILAAEVNEALASRDERRPGEMITMVSVGAGTLLPTLQAAANTGKDNVRIVMLEQDEGSIAMAHSLAEEIGFKGEIVVKKVDCFDPEAMEKTVAELEGTATTVDAVGLYEYINEKATKLKEVLGRGDDYLLFEPVKFMNLINRMVEPGGRLIVGQMRDDRPNADFTMGVIGWPFVVTRSPNELVTLAREAGISPDQMRLALTPLGAYSMLSMDKPLAETRTNGYHHANGSQLAALGALISLPPLQ